MKFTDYEREALRYVRPQPKNDMVFALGLASEAGEVSGLLEKQHGQGHTKDRAKMLKELGDVLWYLTAEAAEQGWTLEEIAAANLQKLAIRYPQGFSTKASVQRVDTK
jgi:NTP pyrophosphatase (non-canonical NTP hydrolase)